MKINDIEIDLTVLTIKELAMLIIQDWKKVWYGAKPYLEALLTMEKITDKYYLDEGTGIVAYFLGNAQTWKGEVARNIKKELNRRLKIRRVG